MSKSKAKGYRHEARIAKVLSTWAGKPFHRTPSSGALRWQGNTWTYSDLIPPEDLCVLVECKHYHALSIEGLLVQNNQILDWWLQLTDDQHRAELALGIVLFPMLVFRRDYGRNFLMIEHRAWDRFPRLNPNPCKRLRALHLVGMNQNTVVCDFNDFLDAVPPDKIRELLSQPIWSRNPILRSKVA